MGIGLHGLAMPEWPACARVLNATEDNDDNDDNDNIFTGHCLQRLLRAGQAW